MMVRKREPRVAVDVAARMRVGSEWRDVAIRNVSSRGMLVSADDPPPPGTYIEIRKRVLVIVARAVWQGDRQFGIRTQDRIDLDALLSNAAAPPPDWVADRDRRRAPRADEVGERNRNLARNVQFVAIAAAVTGTAGYLAMQVGTLLSTPLHAVRTVLGGG